MACSASSSLSVGSFLIVFLIERALAADRLPVALVDLELLDAQALEDAEHVLVDLVGLLDQHLAGLGVDDLLGDHLPEQEVRFSFSSVLASLTSATS